MTLKSYNIDYTLVSSSSSGVYFLETGLPSNTHILFASIGLWSPNYPDQLTKTCWYVAIKDGTLKLDVTKRISDSLLIYGYIVTITV